MNIHGTCFFLDKQESLKQHRGEAGLRITCGTPQTEKKQKSKKYILDKNLGGLKLSNLSER